MLYLLEKNPFDRYLQWNTATKEATHSCRKDLQDRNHYSLFNGKFNVVDI